MRRIPKEGYLQVATGKRHQDEAIGCVQRIRPFLRNRPITLVTDQPDRIPEGFFDTVIAHGLSNGFQHVCHQENH